jgi:DNA topoisomerase-1
VDKDLARKEPDHDKVVALVVKLMELTGIRVGNEAYKKLYGSFGLTTLMNRHVKIEGSTINFEFKGKKGVYHKMSLQSCKAANLQGWCGNAAKYPERNFFNIIMPPASDAR